ncbi:glycosyltransferase family 39 protein [Cryomorphaceae bacterium]|nr:glycosyltransferase family 39 protein [Cryomorphaceae bacterium]
MKWDLNKWAPLLAFLGVLFFVVSLPYRWLDHDEAVLGEHAYWWWKTGQYRSVLHYGLPNGWDQLLYSTHKAFVLLGSASISIFGWSLTALRGIPLFFGIVVIFLVQKYLRTEFENDREYLYWPVTLFLFQAMFFTAAYRFRPETMLMTFGFLNFWLLDSYFKTGKFKYVVLAGICAGLGLFTHLNGAAYAGAGGLLLWSRKKIGPSVAYGILGIAFGSLYLHNMLGPGQFEEFLAQYRQNPNLSEADWHWYSPMVKALSEHLRFFHSAREVSTSLLLLTALIGSWKILKEECSSLLRYFLFTILILGALSRQTPIYYMIYLPFIVVIVSVHLHRWTSLSNIWKGATLFFLAGFLLINSSFSWELISRRTNTVARTTEMVASIPQGSSIVGPTSLLFNALDEGYEIRSFKSFKFLVRNYPDYPDTYEGLVNFLDDTAPDYIILDHIDYNQDEFGDFRDPSELTMSESVGSFQVTETHEDWTLLQRMP